jgi:hypothetical protein
MIRSHPRDDAQTLNEYRVVMLDPVEQAVAPIADPEIVGKLRFLDENTLLVEGRSIWTIRLKTGEEKISDGEPKRESPLPTFSRMLVQHSNADWSFFVEVPDGWQRLPLPPQQVDFTNPADLAPLALFTPNYAAIVFTAAARPILPGATAMAMLQFLAAQQRFALTNARNAILPCGKVAQADAAQTVNNDTMKMRLVVLEDGGTVYALSTMAPAPLWDAVRPMLDRMIESFTLANPKGPTTPSFD